MIKAEDKLALWSFGAFFLLSYVFPQLAELKEMTGTLYIYLTILILAFAYFIFLYPVFKLFEWGKQAKNERITK